MNEHTADLTVGIPTFHRPEALLRCLDGVLPQLDDAIARGLLRTAHVLVVDNSIDGSARAGIAGLVAGSGGRVRYVHEPEPGIAAARNRALDEAGTRLLSYIDDDEVPQREWLVPLVETWRRTGATAVMGRVNAVFDTTPDAWLTAGHIIGRRRMATGTAIPIAAAGNLLVDIAEVKRLGVRFDVRFGLTGGEDTLFSRQLVAAGGTIVWCDESVADDHVPMARFERSWMMRRNRSHGNIGVHIDLVMARGVLARAVVRLRAVARGSVRVVLGSGRYVIGALVRSERDRALGMRTLSRGAGMVTGAFGAMSYEYRRADPSA